MEEFWYGILGMLMIYSVVHFFIVQHNKTWDDRSSYEKFITVFGMVSISLIFFGVMFGE